MTQHRIQKMIIMQTIETHSVGFGFKHNDAKYGVLYVCMYQYIEVFCLLVLLGTVQHFL